jgi:Zn ribbon nucleic-acid-binding protein
MDCPECGADLITDPFEDTELIYCVKCGYQTIDEPEYLGNNGEPEPVAVNEDDWRRDR